MLAVVVVAAPAAAGDGEADRALQGAAAQRGAEPVENGPVDPQIAVLRKLRRADRGPTNVEFVDGFPRFVETSVAIKGRTPIERARNYLERFRGLYAQFMSRPFDRSGARPRSLAALNALPDADPAAADATLQSETAAGRGLRYSNPLLDLALRGTSGPRNGQVLFRQTYRGVPVFGADLIVFVRGERVVGSVGALISDLDVGLRPELTAEDAADAMREEIRSEDAPVVGASHLEILAGELLPADYRGRGLNRLAWQVALGGSQPATGFVDAETGDVNFISRGIRGHDGFDDYDLDLEDANGNSASNSNCYWSTGDNDTLGDEDGLNSDGQSDPEAVELFNLAHDAYAFWHSKFSRHSYDNDGGQFELYVHATPPDTIAGWIGGSVDCDLIDFRNGAVAEDVLIHELTHGVGDFSVLGSPVYQGQSGALDESHADTMGARADGNWLIGEGTSGGAIRDMSDPDDFGDPDHMSEFLNTSSDDGGVHTNSGIPNNAVFLIADGGTHPDSNVTVSGIGKPAEAWLTYMALQVMPPSASFADNRALMVAFADGAYSVNVTCQVRNAWFAVGIGNPDSDCNGTEDNADADGDGVPFGLDNCPGKANPSQLDTDSDGKGNACDGDTDEDGILDVNDNCPGVPNPDQTNGDLDGWGKACDPDEDEDYDNDGVLNDDDNCKFDANSNQLDTDSDGDGDACDPDSDGDGWSNDNDNAPFEYNPGQEDSDGDGLGDVSDDCPNTAEEITAWWAGIPDIGVDPQPVQPDSDGDGTPDACDRDARVRGHLIGWRNVLGTGRKQASIAPAPHLDTYPTRIPLAMGPKVGPDDDSMTFDQGERRRLVLTGVDPDLKVWVGDESGRTVARPGDRAARRRVLRFRPLSGHDYYLHSYFGSGFDPGDEEFVATLALDRVPPNWPDPPPIRRR